MNLKKQMLTLAAIVAGVHLIGVTGYMALEHWNFLDSLYMTVITLTTIGYGETHPLTEAGRIFTIFLILGGIGLIAYAFSSLAALMIGGHLTDAFRRKKMQSDIGKLKGHFIICGAGHTGKSIAQELSDTDRPFVIVEKQAESCSALTAKNWLNVCGDATEDAALKQAGIEGAAGLFCCLEGDKDNAFVALAAKLLNPKLRIISTQLDVQSAGKLAKSGADAVVSPGRIGGLRMVSEMVRPSTVTFLDSMLRDNRTNYRFEDVPVTREGLTAGILYKAARAEGAGIAAIRLADGTFDINPADDRPLKKGETAIALATPEQVIKLRAGI